jgi:preprotein translocase subunit YajC
MTDTSPAHPALALLAQATGQPVQPAGMPNAQPVQATPGTAPGTTGAPAPQASPWGQMGLFLPLIAVFGVIMLMSFWSQRKEKKKRDELMGSMKKGDKVQTFSGIIGTLTEITEHEAVLRVEEGRIRVARSAVQTVLSSKANGAIEPKGAKAEAEQPVNA